MLRFSDGVSVMFFGSRRNLFGYVNSLYLIVLSYLFIFFYWPLLTIIRDAFLLNGSPSLSILLTVISDPVVQSAFYFTLLESTLSTILSVMLGLPIAYILTKYRFPGKKIYEALILVPFVLPGIVVGLAFLLLFGPDGVIPNFFKDIFNLELASLSWGFIGIVFAHAYYNAPLVAVMTTSVWRRLDPEIEEAAETLGVHGFRKFYKITLPLIMPGLLSSALLTFIFCFSSFEIVLLLGNFRFRTLEVQIYHLFRNRLDFAGASALAFLQLSIIAFLTVLYVKSLQKYTDVRKAGRTSKYIEMNLFSHRFSNFLLIAYLFSFIVFQVFPLVLTFYNSVFDPVIDAFTLKGYSLVFSSIYNPYLGSSPIKAPINTLVFSTITAIFAMLFGLISAYATYKGGTLSLLFNVAIFVPLATSRLTIGLGMILTFGSIGFLYQDTRPLIIASHITIAYPFTTRSIMNGLSKIDPFIRESAETLGADPLNRFKKVDLPLLSPSIAVGLSLAFATSLGEFAATNILYRGNYPTLTVLIFVMLGGRQFTAASAAAFLLIILSLAVFLVVVKYSEELSGGF